MPANRAGRFGRETRLRRCDAKMTWSSLVQDRISGQIGGYAVVTGNAGSRHLFLIYFVQGDDGVWRLETM
jgi:hypothetical protein